MPMNRREFLEVSIMAGVAPGLRGCFRSGGEAAAGGGAEADHKDGQLTVAEYVVQRLAALGIKHVFGVPGDYAFPIDLAVERRKDLTWVGCSNELNAAYSADGYARINGAAILCTTYNVGSAAALAGVMGCKAERVPVFHLVGSPSTRLWKDHRHMHHSYGDGDQKQFHSYHEVSVCASAYLNPDNAIDETERVIREAATQRMPVYIEIPEDCALMPVKGTPKPNLPFDQVPTFISDPGELNAALAKIRQRIESANYTIILVAFTIERYGLKKELEDLLRATNIHFATTGMSKGLFSKPHPDFIGMYNGEFSPDVTAIIDKADLVLDLGGVVFCDSETGEFSDHIDPAKIITVFPDHVEFGPADPDQPTRGRVHMKDIIEGLTQNPPSSKPIMGVEKLRLDWDKFSQLIEKKVFHDFAGFLESGDILVTDTGVGDLIATEIDLPEGVQFQHALLWGSIGWGTAVAFGIALAAPNKRVVLIQGDGGHQCTANQIGAMGKYGVNPIIIVLNNDIYGIEEVVMGNDNPRHVQQFDRIAQWDYAKIPDAMGCSNWRTHVVDFTDPWHLDRAVQSFKAAMEDARDRHDTGAYIVVKLNRDLLFPGLPASIRERLYETPPLKA